MKPVTRSLLRAAEIKLTKEAAARDSAVASARRLLISTLEKAAAAGVTPTPMAPAGSGTIAMSKAGPMRGLMNMKKPLGGGPQAGGPTYGKAAIKNLPR